MITDDQTLRRLGEVATVQPGYLSRRRVRPAPAGTHRLLQAKDVSEENGVHWNQAALFHPERKPELYQVTRGDILVVARGQNHRAYHINQDLKNVLAAATFYIVRPNVHHVRPGYLAWWLNLPRVQAEIDTSSRGTSIAYISRESLETLMLPVASISVQEKIERIFFLWRKKRTLQSQLDEKREQHIQAVCRQAVRQSKEQ